MTDSVPPSPPRAARDIRKEIGEFFRSQHHQGGIDHPVIIEDVDGDVDYLLSLVDELVAASVAEARPAMTQLWADLMRFGNHLAVCDQVMFTDAAPCTCGWLKVVERINGALRGRVSGSPPQNNEPTKEEK